MKPAFLMEEIAVDLMSIHNTAQDVYALEEVGTVEELQHLLELQGKQLLQDVNIWVG